MDDDDGNDDVGVLDFVDWKHLLYVNKCLYLFWIDDFCLDLTRPITDWNEVIHITNVQVLESN